MIENNFLTSIDLTYQDLFLFTVWKDLIGTFGNLRVFDFEPSENL